VPGERRRDQPGRAAHVGQTAEAVLTRAGGEPSGRLLHPAPRALPAVARVDFRVAWCSIVGSGRRQQALQAGFARLEGGVPSVTFLPHVLEGFTQHFNKRIGGCFVRHRRLLQPGPGTVTAGKRGVAPQPRSPIRPRFELRSGARRELIARSCSCALRSQARRFEDCMPWGCRSVAS